MGQEGPLDAHVLLSLRARPDCSLTVSIGVGVEQCFGSDLGEVARQIILFGVLRRRARAGHRATICSSAKFGDNSYLQGWQACR